MSRKTATFSMSEETYDRLKTHFPENTGSEANIIALLDALESEQANSEELKQLRAIKSDHSRLAAEHTELQQAAQLQHERNTARIAELEEQLSAYERQGVLFDEQTQTLQEQNAQLAHTIAEHKKTIELLESKQVTWEQIRVTLQPFAAALIDETAKRLSEYFKREILPMSILVDMFLRYTIERNAEWFYPFVLKERDIVDIAHNFNENVVSINQIKKAILGK